MGECEKGGSMSMRKREWGESMRRERETGVESKREGRIDEKG